MEDSAKNKFSHANLCFVQILQVFQEWRITMIIKNGLVFTENGTFEALTVYTKDDLIIKLAPASEAITDTTDTIVDAKDTYVIPGLTDVHFHGCDDYDLCDGSLDAMKAICTYELKSGITSICPATMTLASETIDSICEVIGNYSKNPIQGSDLVGVHMEGPYVSPAKKGAQNGDFIANPDIEKIKDWNQKTNNLVKLVSIAPELDNAIECIHKLKNDFNFSIAHTTADYEIATKAMDAGALHVTHLYNAMLPFAHRTPGVIGAAADRDDCMVELICDGVHIDPAVVRITFKLFGSNRVILISDSMMATGMPDGTYALGGQPVHVKGNVATLDNGALAGSVTNLFDCMRTAINMGIPVADAIKAATINPCRSIKIDQLYGSIKEKKKAHFLLLNKEDYSLKTVIKEQTIL